MDWVQIDNTWQQQNIFNFFTFFIRAFIIAYFTEQPYNIADSSNGARTYKLLTHTFLH